MGARIYLGRDFGMCVEFLTRCHDHFSGVGLGRDFGIWQNLAADLGVDPDDGCSNLSEQRFWHVCPVLDTAWRAQSAADPGRLWSAKSC